MKQTLLLLLLTFTLTSFSQNAIKLIPYNADSLKITNLKNCNTKVEVKNSPLKFTLSANESKIFKGNSFTKVRVLESCGSYSKGWIEVDLTLPVTFGEITAERKNSQLIVNWQTLDEFNNKGFYVMGSEDGKVFKELAFVKSKGNSSNSQNYNISFSLALAAFLPLLLIRRKYFFGAFILAIILFACAKEKFEYKNINYIQIVQEDLDGTVKSSKVVKVLN